MNTINGVSMNKNTIIIVLGIIGPSLFIVKIATNHREIKQDPTNQYLFDEKEAKLDKQYQEIQNTLNKIESDIKRLEK
jgi:hypothetical protein